MISSPGRLSRRAAGDGGDEGDEGDGGDEGDEGDGGDEGVFYMQRIRPAYVYQDFLINELMSRRDIFYINTRWGPKLPKMKNN